MHARRLSDGLRDVGIARRLVRRVFGGLPTARLYRFDVSFGACPAACPTAHTAVRLAGSLDNCFTGKKYAHAHPSQVAG